MTNVTRQELDACARLLGDDYKGGISDTMRLARAAKLRINYEWMWVELPDELYTDDVVKGCWCWPADGTEAECIIKASASVQIEREKQQ